MSETKEKEYNKNVDDLFFLKSQFSKITDKKQFILPSEWVEKNRYLTSDISRMSGYYRFANSPFWCEPLDMLSPLSSIEKLAVCKGVQTGFTVGVLENILAYNIGCNPTPQLYITADEELLKKRFAIHVERLIDSCNLRDKIFSQSGAKTKKTGDTIVMKEYTSGYLWGIGSNNKNKIRSMPFPVILMDEIETFKDDKKEGSTESIADNRSNTFVGKRKLLYGSTPLVLQSSKIWPLFLKGDQRYFFIPCVHCGKEQFLEWHGKNEEGKLYGIVFEWDSDFLPKYETVGYKCKYCGKIMKNNDKALFMSKGRWKPTAKATEPNMVSYHLSSLYSMPGFYSWENIVADWKDAWDLKKNKVKDIVKFREFQNLKLGKPFRDDGMRIRKEKVQNYRNYKYLKNTINNKEFIKDSGSEILFLTCAVDVQLNNLWVHVIGWCAGGRNYMIDFFSIDGETENLQSESWKKLDDFLLNCVWISDDKKTYRIINTFIDSGKYSDYVYSFCKNYSTGVFAIKGEYWIKGGLTYNEFLKKTLEKKGLNIAYHVNTTLIKDRISKYFNLNWDTGKIQPEWYPNFPDDTRDDVFNAFEAEERINEYDKYNTWVRAIWHQISGRENHCFDTYCYNLACLELLADAICRDYLGLDYLDWSQFWEYCKKGYFYTK